ncbi:MAG: outer membrane lipoprotein carrier protein LolA [Pseudomonadota bacterium]
MTTTLTAIAAILALGAAPIALQVQPPVFEDDEPVAEIAPAADETLVPAGEERDAIVAAAAEALSAVGTAKGRFIQIAPDFSMTEGDFALRRPGRVRFDYDEPAPLLIVADGATVAIEDRDLETLDRVPLGATPLDIILDDDLDFDSEAEVTEVRRANGFVAVTLRDLSEEADGLLTLVFEEESYDLVMWRTLDAAGGITSVELADVETNVRINPRLFRIEDPEDEDDRRRR